MSIKAIHIELVSDMTSEAFIAALKRFISRRGIPQQLHCDNGSNFIGAQNELNNLYHLFKTDNHIKLIYEFLSPQHIRFKFNPPNAPHFGGLWESNIKSVKSHFYRVSGTTSFTFEEANTLLIQIEAVLNSRPLCAISDDVTSYDALTPSHFLIGEPLTSIPEPDLSHINSSRMSKWQNIQNRVQTFWKLWSRDYLHTLNQRMIWQNKSNNLNIDQLVIIRDDNTPQSHWIMGRIQQVHCGKDGQVRVATVKTSTSVIKRPIVKLIPLPIEDNNKCNTVTEGSSKTSPLFK